MIVLVISFYVIIFSYDIVKLMRNGLKKEIPVYVFLMSISVVISLLIALKIHIPDPMIYFGKILKLLNGIWGG